MGIQVLAIKKEMYFSKEQIMSQQVNNFFLFMSIINEKGSEDKKASVLQTLTLLFSNSNVFFTPRSMVLKIDEEMITIDEGNFEILQDLIRQCFCLQNSDQQEYNPKGKKAQEIAQKIMESRRRIASQKASEQKGSVFSQYLSTLTVGIASMSLQNCINLTMYQVYDLIERYSLYLNWDIDIRSRMAGAKVEHPVENWMKQIH